MQSDDEENKANEPLPEYNRIVFFKSFEEMNEYDHREMASHTPIQRLQNITKMIMSIHGNDFKNKMNDLTIHFK